MKPKPNISACIQAMENFYSLGKMQEYREMKELLITILLRNKNP